MTASSFGVLLGAINIVFLLATVAVGVVGIVKTKGRTRGLIIGGVSALVLSRLFALIVSPLAAALSSGGIDSFYAVQVAITVGTSLLLLAGILLLILAAITAATDRRPVQAPGYAPGPGYGPPSGGLR